MLTYLLSIVPSMLAIVKLEELWNVLESTVIFVALGLIVFALAFLIVVLAAPFSVKKEIEEDQNTSLAIIIGAVIIGIAMIISAAIQGN
jgi:putative membrane protein